MDHQIESLKVQSVFYNQEPRNTPEYNLKWDIYITLKQSANENTINLQ